MDADLVPQVIEYLSKKGYTKTEAMLRAESAVQDVESTSLGTRMVGSDSPRYMKGLGELQSVLCTHMQFRTI